MEEESACYVYLCYGGRNVRLAIQYTIAMQTTYGNVDTEEGTAGRASRRQYSDGSSRRRTNTHIFRTLLNKLSMHNNDIEVNIKMPLEFQFKSLARRTAWVC